MQKDLLELKNPTVGQLIYMKDLYSKQTLLYYMVGKWTRKFNTHMSPKDWEQWSFELKYLDLDSTEVLANIDDWCNI